ncbi:MAG: DNA primase [Candidatus Omnitrophota bacterium]
MGKIPQEIIDQLLDRLDVVDVISGYVPLKKNGRNFKANCPFHDEKTPSFVVSPEKQIYHCFGCGEGGNAIGFVMKYESMEFPEAVKMLSVRAGIELPVYKRENKEEESLASRLYKVNDLAALFYQNYLMSENGKKALGYLKERGIDSAALRLFKIGYAPDAWDMFRVYCEKKKIDQELLRKAGLTIRSEKTEKDYDRFRNRVVYPILSERGKVLGFGGRVMDDSLPKYINSPETAVYVKSNVLYGLNLSKKGIREKGYALVVEGYMDVIVPFQYGVDNVVATSGTSLTPDHVTTLKRYTDTAVIIFDADEAGETASLRGLDIFAEKNVRVKIASLPKGEDPDSFVKKHGRKSFEEIVDSAKDLFDYKLDLLVARHGISDVGRVAGEMMTTISKVENVIVRSSYLKRLAERLEVHEESLRHEMLKFKSGVSRGFTAEPEIVRVAAAPRRNSEIHLLAVAFTSKKMFKRIVQELGIDIFMDAGIQNVLNVLEKLFQSGEEKINPGKLLSRLEENIEAKFAAIEAFAKIDIIKDPDKDLDDCISFFLKQKRIHRLSELTHKLKKAHAMNNIAEVRELLRVMNDVHKEKVA